MKRWLWILPLLLLPVAAFAQGAPSPNVEPPTLRLLALAYEPQADREVIATVDPATGGITPFGAGISGCCSTPVLDAALDTAGNRYFAVLTKNGESTPRLMHFDTQSGQAGVSEPLTITLPVSATDTMTAAFEINYLAYDPTAMQLLALAFAPQTLTMRAVTIDPATAVVSPLGEALDGCCTPLSFDAAYDSSGRRLFVVMQRYDGGSQPRLLTISGASGEVTGDVPITGTLAVDHLAYAAGDDILWALVNDPQNDAQRLAQINIDTGAVTPVGEGVERCCALLLPADAALNAVRGELVAPMIDISDPQVDDLPHFFRYSLASGALLSRAPVDPNYDLHYIAWQPLPELPEPPEQDKSLFLPLLQR